MKVLSVNAGSSSLKFSLFDMANNNILASGVFERIGIEGSTFTIKFNGEKIVQEVELNNHVDAVNILIDKLISLDIIKSLEEINGIGHRVAHGKDYFDKSTIINDSVLEKLRELKDMAPLHNPANLLGIEAFEKALPNIVQVAVFDTAYHQSMNEVSYLYPVPYAWYREYGLRKYGFHGTSHKYIAREAKKILGRDNYKLISCHIGNGGSICAIKDGKCVDTSMGFTPLAGIMMGTRSGDVDPSIIPYIMEKEGKNASEVIEDLNKKSGLYGMSEFSNDMRDILTRCNEGDHRALVAKEKYVRRIVDYIAQYYVLLGGVDMIALTAGVGENNKVIRKEILDKLECLGVKISDKANEIVGEEIKLSTKDSKILVYVIPTDEELMIAKDTYNLINR